MKEYRILSFSEAHKLGCTDEFGCPLNEGYDWEYRCGIVLFEDDKPIKMVGSDGGEPEDQTLYRDWSWVAAALNEALKMKS